MTTSNKVAIFNRIYTGREGKDDIFVIEFPEQLEFYMKDDKLCSNKYNIEVDTNMKKEEFYQCIQTIINEKYDNNELDGAIPYTKSQWHEYILTWDLPEVK